MKKLLLATVLMISAVPTLFAQTPVASPSPSNEPFLEKAIAAMQTQRNNALDQAAIWEAKAHGLEADLAAAQKKIKDLETPSTGTPSAGTK